MKRKINRKVRKRKPLNPKNFANELFKLIFELGNKYKLGIDETLKLTKEIVDEMSGVVK